MAHRPVRGNRGRADRPLPPLARGVPVMYPHRVLHGGELAERLRSGLQIRVDRFDSGTRLHHFSMTCVSPSPDVGCRFTTAFTVLVMLCPSGLGEPLQDRVGLVRRDPGIVFDDVRCVAETPTHVRRDLRQAEAGVEEPSGCCSPSILQSQIVAEGLGRQPRLVAPLAQSL